MPFQDFITQYGSPPVLPAPEPALDYAGTLERLIRGIEERLAERCDQLGEQLATHMDHDGDVHAWLERQLERVKDEAHSDLHDLRRDLER